MLDTRFTAQGKRKKQGIRWQQKYAVGLIAALSLAFFATGLRYMVTYESYAATVRPPDFSAEAPPATTPSTASTALHANTAPQSPGAAPTALAQPQPSATPLAPIVFEDEENGIWKYETARYSINITREKPLPSAVATVAVLSGDTSSLVSAFAGGAFGKNIHERTSEIAKEAGAIFAVNGDYCGFRSDGVIVRNGVLLRNKPARDMLAIFSGGEKMQILSEQETQNVEALIETGLMQTLSFGPALVKNGLVLEKFDTDVPGTNPRTAIGQKENGDLVFVVVDGRISGYSEGMKIEELAQYMLDLGCETAYNLDGGMTSCMVFNDKIISRPCGAGGRERPLSDILCVLREPE